MGILGEIIDISAVCVSKLSYLIFFVLQQAVLLLKKTKLELMIPIFPARAISPNLQWDNYFTCFFMSISCWACCWTKALCFDTSSSWKSLIRERSILGGNPAKWKGIELTRQKKTDLKESAVIFAAVLSVCCFQWLQLGCYSWLAGEFGVAVSLLSLFSELIGVWLASWFWFERYITWLDHSISLSNPIPQGQFFLLLLFSWKFCAHAFLFW